MTTVSDLDLMRCTKLVLDRYGEDALIRASRRADSLQQRGDMEGSAGWRKIGGILEAARLAARVETDEEDRAR